VGHPFRSFVLEVLIYMVAQFGLARHLRSDALEAVPPDATVGRTHEGYILGAGSSCLRRLPTRITGLAGSETPTGVRVLC